MTLNTGAGAAITKAEVGELLGQFNYVSAAVLGHPKFDDESRKMAIDHTAMYIVVLGELFAGTSGEHIDGNDIAVVMNATKYLQFVNEFCAD